MSVANILDPATGLIRSEYLSPASTFPPNEVRDWTAQVPTITVPPGGADVLVPGTSTTVAPAELYSVLGFSQLFSSTLSVGGSNMALYVRLTGPGQPDIKIVLNGGIEDNPSSAIVNTFTCDVSIPALYNNLSLVVGNGGVANVGTITLRAYEVFINKISP